MFQFDCGTLWALIIASYKYFYLGFVQCPSGHNACLSCVPAQVTGVWGGGYNLNSHNLSERLLEVIQLRVLKLYKIVWSTGIVSK